MHAGYLPGYPASHGCVRMPEWMAKHFFDAAPIGTPVEVVP
jgi:lipoprotein-anchoring transpeptidase ErfK/SrfK